MDGLQNDPEGSPRRRRGGLLQVAAQAAIVIAAGWWLWASGRIDLAALRAQLTPAAVTAWVLLYLGIHALIAWRWQLLSRHVGLPLTFWQAFRYLILGLFWGTFTPGGVGVDVSRIWCVAKQFPGRTGPAALTVLVDRLMIVSATFLVCGLALPQAWPLAMAHPVLLTLVACTALTGLGLVGLMLALLYAPVERTRWGARLVAGRLAQTHEALRQFRDRPGLLLFSFVLAMVSQTATVGLIGVLLHTGPGLAMSWSHLALIVPLGWHAMSLPVAPAGLGVGNAAFDQLFVWAGMPISIGATVATTYQACQVTFHVAGGLIAMILPRTPRHVGITPEPSMGPIGEPG